MTEYLKKSFSVNMADNQQYRDNWETIFGKKEDVLETEAGKAAQAALEAMPVVEKPRRSDIRKQVEEFHHLMGQPVLTSPAVPVDARVRLRLHLVAEEFFELLYACGFDDDDLEDDVRNEINFMDVGVQLPEVADALADLDYVVEGMRLELGINGAPIADVVHESNIAKVGGPIVNGKIQKPEGWTPPDIAAELEKQK